MLIPFRPIKVVLNTIGFPLLAFLFTCCKPAPVKSVKDIPDIRLVVTSEKCDKIIYSSNTNNIYRPWILEGAFGKTEVKNYALSIDPNLELFSRSISCDCNTIALFEMDKDQQGSKVMYLYDVNTNKIQNLNEKMKTKFGQSTLFSPSAFQFAYIDSTSQLQILDYKISKNEIIKNPEGISFNDLIWSVTGKNIFLVDDSTSLWKYNIRNKTFKKIWNAPLQSLSDNPRMLTPSIDDDDILYFRSDHESNFMQVYKYDSKKGVHLLFPSNHTVSLLQIPIKETPFYYKEYKDGFVTLKKYENGKSYDIFPNRGVVFNYYPINSILAYADHQHPFSIYKSKNGSLINLVQGMKDEMPDPLTLKNKYGVNNFIYFPLNATGKWTVIVHGGPHQTILRKYDRFISHLVKSGIGVIVLYYPGSAGMGKAYEMRDNPNLEKVILKNIEADLNQIKSAYPQIQKLTMIGISYGANLTHLYSLSHKDVIKLIDLSGLGSFSARKDISTLYIYGRKDAALEDIDRKKMIERDSINGNGKIFSEPNEGHVIAHKKSVQALLDAMIDFINE